MSHHFDFKEEWEKTRKVLKELGKESVKLAKKGEGELLRISEIGKLHVDSTSVRMKKEHLYYLIGKEYAKLKKYTPPTDKIKKLMVELKKAEQQQRSLKKKISKKK